LAPDFWPSLSFHSDDEQEIKQEQTEGIGFRA
jgi:hypothetical protein